MFFKAEKKKKAFNPLGGFILAKRQIQEVFWLR